MSFKHNPPLIAVVDDEPDILELIRLNLDRAGFSVHTFSNAVSIRNFLKKETPDLFILDRMLPDAEGLDICRELRRNSITSEVPIIMVTAKADELDRVLGLEIGADDYVVKPFSPRELVARVRARLRSFNTVPTEPDSEEKKLVFANGNFIIDFAGFRVMVDHKSITLTTTEFRILRMLAEKPGRVFSRDEILEQLWGGRKLVQDRTIDVHICNLRDRLGRFTSIIRNIKGVGYRFEFTPEIHEDKS